MNSGTDPPSCPGCRKLHWQYRLLGSPSPDWPQMLAIVTEDKMLLNSVNGVCTSYRNPPVSVTSGRSRQESCMNEPKTLMPPLMIVGPNSTYLLVAGSRMA